MIWKQLSDRNCIPLVKVIVDADFQLDEHNQRGLYQFKHLSMQESSSVLVFLEKIRIIDAGRFWNSRLNRISNELLGNDFWDNTLRLLSDHPNGTTTLFPRGAYTEKGDVSSKVWERICNSQKRHPNLTTIDIRNLTGQSRVITIGNSTMYDILP